MKYKNKMLFIFLSLISVILTLNIDPNDLLQGNGLFPSQILGDLSSDGVHVTSFLSVNSSNVLKLQKPSSQSIGFSTGLEQEFISSNPKHITFQFSSISTQTQDANLRLIDTISGSTVLLFRAGKAGLIRVNQNQMVQFYNNSVSTDFDINMVKIDLKLNWQKKKIDIFVNQVFKGQSNFFQETSSVNKLRLYNLYPSTSYWKNIAVCKQICYSFVYQKSLIILKTIFLLLLVIVS